MFGSTAGSIRQHAPIGTACHDQRYCWWEASLWSAAAGDNHLMNLNWARIKLREKENQLSSRYDRGPLNSVIILQKRHYILERYYFGTRKHIEVKDGGREGGVQFFEV